MKNKHLVIISMLLVVVGLYALNYSSGKPVAPTSSSISAAGANNANKAEAFHYNDQNSNIADANKNLVKAPVGDEINNKFGANAEEYKNKLRTEYKDNTRTWRGAPQQYEYNNPNLQNSPNTLNKFGLSSKNDTDPVTRAAVAQATNRGPAEQAPNYNSADKYGNAYTAYSK